MPLVMSKTLSAKVSQPEQRAELTHNIQLCCAVYLQAAVPAGGYVSQVSAPTIQPIYKGDDGEITFLLTFAAVATIPVYDDPTPLPDNLQAVVDQAVGAGMGTRISG